MGISLYGVETDGETIPPPMPMSQIHVKENERVVLIDVYMPVVRMAQKNRAVNRTVTLPAWLNAAAQEAGVNFSQVLQDALKQLLSI